MKRCYHFLTDTFPDMLYYMPSLNVREDGSLMFPEKEWFFKIFSTLRHKACDHFIKRMVERKKHLEIQHNAGFINILPVFYEIMEQAAYRG
jgi:hypothetical protein